MSSPRFVSLSSVLLFHDAFFDLLVLILKAAYPMSGCRDFSPFIIIIGSLNFRLLGFAFCRCKVWLHVVFLRWYSFYWPTLNDMRFAKTSFDMQLGEKGTWHADRRRGHMTRSSVVRALSMQLRDGIHQILSRSFKIKRPSDTRSIIKLSTWHAFCKTKGKWHAFLRRLASNNDMQSHKSE